jgi:tetratricopeptide (TPR) repeat protein
LEITLGENEDALNSYNKSLIFYNEALLLAPKDTDVHYNKAVLLKCRAVFNFALQRESEARLDLSAALDEISESSKLAPNNSFIQQKKEEIVALIEEINTHNQNN